MKVTHSIKRAEERYQICDFNPAKALSIVLDGKCVQIKESLEKFSRTFLIQYFNKYVILVTDYNIHFVKTCMPFKDEYAYLDLLLKECN